MTIMPRNIDRTMKAYPLELDGTGSDITAERKAEMAQYAARKAEMAASMELGFGGVDAAGSVLWAVVLWFGVLNDIFFPRAARPSDLVLPALAKVLGYSAEKDEWLRDFENGSRGEYPVPLLGVGGLLFLGGGFIVEQVLKILADGDAGLSCQLGVIGCIWAGLYEIGRIETGDALNTAEVDAENQRLWEEFESFADIRLERASELKSTNQVEIVRAFRRFHSRHRSVEYGGATDAEIVENLRRWYRQGYGVMSDVYASRNGADRLVSTAPQPSSAGFFKGIVLKETTVF